MSKVFTLDEVAQHNSREDCWLIIFGKVYDATKFLEEHPGGDEIILKSTGKDATAEFDDVGHSHEAWHILGSLYVGDVDKSNIKTEYAPTKLQLDPNRNKQDKTKAFIIKFFQFLVPFIILNVAFAFYSKS
ncbi:hypothetical protein ACJIZ3_017702 [Penstemon smallii]|uniref:Cytochrome b5 heme-binding domain-containing protein n=1 Tax=Penstemon smallii TaxID=265156 RepID=A0ABD3SWR7_9LAMI